jgi:hypothetical protein
MEEKRQIVQDGLNKRKTKRKQAIIDAEQDAITMQMIDIVNRNAKRVETQSQAELAKCQEHKYNKKKISNLNKNNDIIIVRLYAFATAFILAIMLYVFHLTQLWSLIASSVLLAICFAFDAYILIQNARELAKLKKRMINNA